MTKRTRTQVYFTEEQRRALDELAARDGKTMAEVVREAAATYVARHERTVHLPADVAALLESAAAARGASAEQVAVQLLSEVLVAEAPRPKLPLFDEGWDESDDARRVDELLADGFGQDR
ncbi:MAG TPA: CopG family transcriptional regulator [Nitriliruptorales bacterium]